MEAIFKSNVLRLSESLYRSTATGPPSFPYSPTKPEILVNVVHTISREFLACVRCADITWTLPCLGQSVFRLFGNKRLFEKFLQSLVIALPGLKTLRLKVNSYSSLHTLENDGEQVMIDVVAPLSRMLAQYNNLDCTLSLDQNTYGDVVCYVSKKHPDKVQPLAAGKAQGVWLNVGDKQDGIGCLILGHYFVPSFQQLSCFLLRGRSGSNAIDCSAGSEDDLP